MTSEGGKFYSLLLPRLPRRDTPGIAVGEKLRLAKSHQPDFPVTLRWYGAATKAAWAGNSAESCNSQQIFGASIFGVIPDNDSRIGPATGLLFSTVTPADPPIFPLPMNRSQT
ncbi:MAG: hypothetical protein AUH08_01085 [Verrucomicrobia bacterium 13_2_20CM_54_12]|nr:MAG: hypothetical protein AUH08_01085 [Verrucomicrobia bacterium 13_2_20CM_54_12]